MERTTTNADPTAEIPAGGRRRLSWVTVLVWLAVAAFLLLLFFGLRRAQEGPVQPGAPAPQFSLTTFDGQTIDTQQLRGQVVVVNFWASWCVPCEQEAAALQQAYEANKDRGVVFLGVDYVDTEPEARGYLARIQHYLSQRAGPRDADLAGLPHARGPRNLHPWSGRIAGRSPNRSLRLGKRPPGQH